MEEDIRHGVVTQLTTEEERTDLCYKRILIFTEWKSDMVMNVIDRC